MPIQHGIDVRSRFEAGEIFLELILGQVAAYADDNRGLVLAGLLQRAGCALRAFVVRSRHKPNIHIGVSGNRGGGDIKALVGRAVIICLNDLFRGEGGHKLGELFHRARGTRHAGGNLAHGHADVANLGKIGDLTGNNVIAQIFADALTYLVSVQLKGGGNVQAGFIDQAIVVSHYFDASLGAARHCNLGKLLIGRAIRSAHPPSGQWRYPAR